MKLLLWILGVVVLLGAAAVASLWWYDHVGQKADPDFVARVAHPAYATGHPRVAIDAAHHNFHTASGRYRAFADLLRADGLRVDGDTHPFTADSLKQTDIMVVANAAGPDGYEDRPAFTPEEEQALLDWVQGGGKLLLIADHAPFGAAAERLAQRFGVTMHLRYARDDKFHEGWDNERLLFSRQNGLLGNTPLTQGRNASEAVGTVVAFTGQSLSAPAGCMSALKLGPDAYDWESRSVRYPAGGHALAVACTAGTGRVVIVGEAAMFSAQVDPLGYKFGMNRAGNDDRQFALNIVHWLLPPAARPLSPSSVP